jgi:hypothetical protein
LILLFAQQWYTAVMFWFVLRSCRWWRWRRWCRSRRWCYGIVQCDFSRAKQWHRNLFGEPKRLNRVDNETISLQRKRRNLAPSSTPYLSSFSEESQEGSWSSPLLELIDFGLLPRVVIKNLNLRSMQCVIHKVV